MHENHVTNLLMGHIVYRQDLLQKKIDTETSMSELRGSLAASHELKLIVESIVPLMRKAEE